VRDAHAAEAELLASRNADLNRRNETATFLDRLQPLIETFGHLRLSRGGERLTVWTAVLRPPASGRSRSSRGCAMRTRLRRSC
jgi:hypothetical protein